MKIPSLDTLEALSVTNSKQIFPAHYHETYCITLLQKGCLIENEVIGIAGRILISYPSEVHFNQPMGDSSYSFATFYISPDLMRAATRVVEPIFAEKVIEDLQAYRQFEQVLKEGQNQSGSQFWSEQLLMSALQYLYKQHGDKTLDRKLVPDQLLGEAKQYILEKLDTPIRVEALAAIYHMSKCAFIRWFKKHTGLTPYTFVLLHRIERSKASIRAGKSLAETALETGFYDQSHFNTYFKRFVGLTPAAYRKSAIFYKTLPAT